VKFRDAELTRHFRYRVSVGSRDLADGVVEVTRRATGEKTRVPVADAVARLREILAAKDALSAAASRGPEATRSR